MADNVIRYELIFQRALRSLVREALYVAEREGLPQPHHFYITFGTTEPGVKMAAQLLQQFPEQMTIVLEHQFFDLLVEEESFSVTLGFGPRKERLTVPFAAIRMFHDPGAEPFPLPNIYMQAEQGFGIQFLNLGDETAAEAEDEEEPSEEENSGGADVIMLDAFLKRPDKS